MPIRYPKPVQRVVSYTSWTKATPSHTVTAPVQDACKDLAGGLAQSKANILS